MRENIENNSPQIEIEEQINERYKIIQNHSQCRRAVENTTAAFRWGLSACISG